MREVENMKDLVGVIPTHLLCSLNYFQQEEFSEAKKELLESWRIMLNSQDTTTKILWRKDVITAYSRLIGDEQNHMELFVSLLSGLVFLDKRFYFDKRLYFTVIVWDFVGIAIYIGVELSELLCVLDESW